MPAESRYSIEDQFHARDAARAATTEPTEADRPRRPVYHRLDLTADELAELHALRARVAELKAENERLRVDWSRASFAERPLTDR